MWSKRRSNLCNPKEGKSTYKSSTSYELITMNSAKIVYDEAWNTEASKYTQAVKESILLFKTILFQNMF